MELGRLLFQKRLLREDTDVVFDVGAEGVSERLDAHKVVVSARSPVLAAELRGGFREAGEHCVRVPDVEPAVFEAFLAFIYLDEVRLVPGRDTVDSVLQLAVLTDRYDVQDTRKALVDTLKPHVVWGKSVGTCLSQLLMLPPGSQRRKDLVDVCLEKMRSMHYVPHFDSEMRALSRREPEVLRAKSFILEVLMCKSAKAKYSTKRDGSLYPGSSASLVDTDLAERMAQELRNMTEGWEELLKGSSRSSAGSSRRPRSPSSEEAEASEGGAAAGGSGPQAQAKRARTG
jgi:hypothetical protein